MRASGMGAARPSGCARCFGFATSWLAVVGLLGGIGCGHTGPEPQPSTAASAAPAVAPETPGDRGREARAAASPTGTQAPTGASSTPPAPKGRSFYALAEHVERAELSEVGQAGSAVRVLDFGELSGAQYTLGGWLTGTGSDHKFGDDRALIGLSKVLKLALPIEHDGASQLSLRVRSFAHATLSVHVNGERLVDVPLDGKTFKVIERVVPEGLLKRGENMLQLRVNRSGASPRGGEASVAIDWIRVGPAQAAHAQSAPPTLASLAAPSVREGEKRALHIRSGHRLAYSFEVPAGAELRGTLASGKAAITLERDGKPAETLLSSATANQPLRIELSRFAGELVRLSITAEGNVELSAPEIVVVDATSANVLAAPQPAVRNLIIVLIDTLRADKLSPYKKDTRVKTPGLSTFLQSAAVMLNARTQENWTKPSVATLLSSLLPWQHNAFTDDARVPDSVELLPELLRERGYYTGAFIANGYVSDKFGFKQGWSTYRNYIREGRRTIAQEVAKDVVEWLDSRPKDKPFFMYMHTIDPHVPYKPPKSFLDLYDPKPYAGPVDFSKTNELLEKIKIGSLKLNERDKVRLEALYDGEISYHDVHFAATLRALEERGLEKETAIVVTSDHGEEFWDHGSVGHGHSVYDELLHVPMIVRIPGLTEGKQALPDAVGLIDVMPTVLEAMGQERPDYLVGQSFVSELQGKGSSAPRSALSGFMQSWRTIGVGSLKLTQRGPDNMRLYDVKQDPHEATDIAAQRPLALRYARGLLGVMIAQSAAGVTHGSSSSSSAKAPNVAVQKAREHKQEKTEIDPETEAQLRALGYVGTSRPKAEAKPKADAK